MRTTIAVCYKAGTQEILWTWFVAIFKHTGPCKIVVITADLQSQKEATEIINGLEHSKANMEVVQVTMTPCPPARIHGTMLDNFLASNMVTTEFFLTMDSDCFPVADGWLEDLEGMLDKGAKVAGIRHPWAPPSEDMDHCRIEWRVRSQHCWNNTHVACQMLRYADLKELGVKYAGGDDTGLLVPLMAGKRGWKIDGFKVSRCAKPRDTSDPEFNRYVCLIFGDKVYHHGGFTRVATMGDKPMLAEAYGWVSGSILEHRGSEFMLSDEYSYKFKLDREEEVAKDKMDRLFGAQTMGLKL